MIFVEFRSLRRELCLIYLFWGIHPPQGSGDEFKMMLEKMLLPGSGTKSKCSLLSYRPQREQATKPATQLLPINQAQRSNYLF